MAVFGPGSGEGVGELEPGEIQARHVARQFSANSGDSNVPNDAGAENDPVGRGFRSVRIAHARRCALAGVRLRP